MEVVGELAAATDVRDTRVSCSKGRSVAGVRNAVNIAVGDADLSCPKVDVQALGVLNELEHPARDGTIKTPPRKGTHLLFGGNRFLYVSISLKSPKNAHTKNQNGAQCPKMPPKRRTMPLKCGLREASLRTTKRWRPALSHSALLTRVRRIRHSLIRSACPGAAAGTETSELTCLTSAVAFVDIPGFYGQCEY